MCRAYLYYLVKLIKSATNHNYNFYNNNLAQSTPNEK